MSIPSEAKSQGGVRTKVRPSETKCQAMVRQRVGLSEDKSHCIEDQIQDVERTRVKPYSQPGAEPSEKRISS